MIQDRDDYPELVHGFRPDWLVDIRGYQLEQQILASFRDSVNSGAWDDDGFPLECAEVDALELHGLGDTLEDDYSEESSP